ncbi:hypothetical protein M422DRAFT_251064 [Sphaerobolus stellatus SS14]|uniref:Uncharacterized protein n=1 Tax=Sphaerobolus stellatus (strain SS14) TaxID=990650 RepID=A0A0C9USD5_SPHS4|nr:hypothetical protein M422DRAFT_251064 [Sphaerobolus stellatus SS14]
MVMIFYYLYEKKIPSVLTCNRTFAYLAHKLDIARKLIRPKHAPTWDTLPMENKLFVDLFRVVITEMYNMHGFERFTIWIHHVFNPLIDIAHEAYYASIQNPLLVVAIKLSPVCYPFRILLQSSCTLYTLFVVDSPSRKKVSSPHPTPKRLLLGSNSTSTVYPSSPQPLLHSALNDTSQSLITLSTVSSEDPVCRMSTEEDV